MKVPTKFRINTEEFKVYFDNNKKTHVCENVETGEKTNIGVLGIFMQMGILKPMEQEKTSEEKITFLSDRISQLEEKIDDLMKNLDTIVRKSEIKKIEEVETKAEEELEPEETKIEVGEKPKSEIKKRIMKKVLEQAEEEEEEPEEEIETEEETEPEETNAEVESEEEINNWMEI